MEEGEKVTLNTIVEKLHTIALKHKKNKNFGFVTNTVLRVLEQVKVIDHILNCKCVPTSISTIKVLLRSCADSIAILNLLVSNGEELEISLLRIYLYHLDGYISDSRMHDLEDLNNFDFVEKESFEKLKKHFKDTLEINKKLICSTKEKILSLSISEQIAQKHIDYQRWNFVDFKVGKKFTYSDLYIKTYGVLHGSSISSLSHEVHGLSLSNVFYDEECEGVNIDFYKQKTAVLLVTLYNVTVSFFANDPLIEALEL